MSKFLENLAKVETEFASAMDFEAGKGIKIRTIFNGIKKLEKGDFEKMTEMYSKMGFAPQNKVFQVICKMLENEGTPISEICNGRGKKKLTGTAFAEELLKSKGLSLK